MQTPTKGACKAAYTLTELGAEGKEGLSLLSKSEQEVLKSILPYISFQPKGINTAATIVISGASLQVIDGLGAEAGGTNGTGNIVLGFHPQRALKWVIDPAMLKPHRELNSRRRNASVGKSRLQELLRRLL